jgi:hypothetical protein
MSNGYPSGAATDPHAPYNQPDRPVRTYTANVLVSVTAEDREHALTIIHDELHGLGVEIHEVVLS